jgi:hypothetical protein
MFLYYWQKGIGGQAQDFYFYKLTEILSGGGVTAKHQTYHSTKLCKTRAVHERRRAAPPERSVKRIPPVCCTLYWLTWLGRLTFWIALLPLFLFLNSTLAIYG